MAPVSKSTNGCVHMASYCRKKPEGMVGILTVVYVGKTILYGIDTFRARVS